MDRDNVRRGQQFRELVAVTLERLGLDGVSPRVVSRRTSMTTATSDDALTQGDLLGLPSQWLVRVHSDVNPRPGRLLDVARQSARLAGREHSAVILYRREHPASGAMVVLALEDFAAVMKHERERWDLLAEHERFQDEQQKAEV